jgi:hypothetical protein
MQENIPKLDTSNLPDELLEWGEKSAAEMLAVGKIQDGSMLGVLVGCAKQLRAEIERLQAENRKLSERLAVVRQAANRAIDHIIRSQGGLFSMSGKLRQALKEE